MNRYQSGIRDSLRHNVQTPYVTARTFLTRCFVLISVLIGLAALNAAPAQAQTKQDTATKDPPLLTIPFNPPLGETFNYTVLVEKQRPRTGHSSMEYEQQLRFETLDKGYLLFLKTLAINVNGTRIDLRDPDQLAAVPAAMRPFLMPVTVELDIYGEMMRLRDWEQMRADLEGLPEFALERIDEDSRDGALAAIKMVLDPMINSTAEDAPAILIQGWPSILGYGEVELEEGQPFEAGTEMGGVMSDQPIDATFELLLSQNEFGDYRLQQTTRPDPEALLEETRALLGRVSKTIGTGANGENVEDALGGARIIMTNDMEVVFERVTGVPKSAIISRTVKVEANGEESARSDTITITRQ